MNFIVFLFLSILFSMTSVVFSHVASQGEKKTEQKIVNQETLELKNFVFRALKGAKNGSAYLTMVQTGEDSDKLIAAECPFSNSVEFHNHDKDHETGVKKMVKISSIPLPGMHNDCNFFTCWFNEKQHPVELKKGGMHLMLMDIKPEAVDLKTLPITLIFEKAGKVTIDFLPEASGCEKIHHCDCHANHEDKHSHGHKSANSHSS